MKIASKQTIILSGQELNGVIVKGIKATMKRRVTIKGIDESQVEVEFTFNEDESIDTCRVTLPEATEEAAEAEGEPAAEGDAAQA